MTHSDLCNMWCSRLTSRWQQCFMCFHSGCCLLWFFSEGHQVTLTFISLNHLNFYILWKWTRVLISSSLKHFQSFFNLFNCDSWTHWDDSNGTVGCVQSVGHDPMFEPLWTVSRWAATGNKRFYGQPPHQTFHKVEFYGC